MGQNKRKNKGAKATKVTTLYDSKGLFKIKDEKQKVDVCDCLEASCPGCYFPCKKCGSEKCGVVCRCNRDYIVHEISLDGKLKVIKNTFLGRVTK